MKVRYLDKGSLEERVNVVVNAVLAGWELRQDFTYGAHLIDPDDGEIVVVLCDVMEFLIDHNVIEFHPERGH